MSIIITLTGPSASGKTEFERRLRDRGFTALVSTTTRAPREGEVDGKDYHFISRDEFLAQRDRGEFIEWAEFNGNLYGTRAKALFEAEQSGKPVAVVLEPQGVRNLRRYCADNGLTVYSVFMDTPVRESLRRLVRRAREDGTPFRVLLSRLLVLLGQEAFWRFRPDWDELLYIPSIKAMPDEAFRLATLRWAVE